MLADGRAGSAGLCSYPSLGVSGSSVFFCLFFARMCMIPSVADGELTLRGEGTAAVLLEFGGGGN